MMGTRTIRKENCAITSLLTPQSRPVAMVVPERERPGATANAWPMPTAKACRYDIPLRTSVPPEAAGDFLPPKRSDRKSSRAVTSRQHATTVRLSPNKASTLSLNSRPTRATGTIDTTSLNT